MATPPLTENCDHGVHFTSSSCACVCASLSREILICALLVSARARHCFEVWTMPEVAGATAIAAPPAAGSAANRVSVKGSQQVRHPEVVDVHPFLGEVRHASEGHWMDPHALPPLHVTSQAHATLQSIRPAQLLPPAQRISHALRRQL